jgi:hypothetical protein
MSLEASRINYIEPRGAIKMKILFIQLDICDWGVTTNYDDLSSVIWSLTPNSKPYNVEGMFNSCSYGMVDMSESRILRNKVPIPCEGTTRTGVYYNSVTCPYIEWSEVANDYIRTYLKQINPESYKYKVYIINLPGGRSGVCSWGGMAYVGCGDDCRAWIHGSLSNVSIYLCGECGECAVI